MNISKISKLILKASKLKKQGKNGEYLSELRKLRIELAKQMRELDEGIKIINKKIEEAERR
jgi:hypothetical protein